MKTGFWKKDWLLGREPKLGRVVAIKTIALAQEFEADELAEVKERFFREAACRIPTSSPSSTPAAGVDISL